MLIVRFVVTLILSGLAVTLAMAAEAPLRGNFEIESGGRKLRLWYYRSGETKADAPVVFVIHGVGRNADEYLDDWVEFAEKKHFLLIAPEFSKKEFPGEEGFNSGNLFDAQGRPRPVAAWSFSMIEPAFDAVREKFGSRQSHYLLYGHSAGAQFVQRFLYFVPNARVSRVIAANAGWYMMPDLAVDFPYGLKGTVATTESLRTAFARPVTILLGEADVDAKHPSLRHSPEADAQGLYRFARGQYFFAQSRETAARMGVPFNWNLATAPGIAHSNKGMAPFAARLFFPE